MKRIILFGALIISAMYLHGQIMPMTPQTRSIIDIANSVISSTDDVGTLIGTKASFEAELKSIRKQYWKQHSQGNISEEVKIEYARLLGEKDIFFLLAEYQKYSMGKLTGKTYSSIRYANGNDVLNIADNPLMNLLGGPIDNGIHEKAKRSFTAWQNYVLENWYNKSGTVLDKGILVSVLKSDTILLKNYIKDRDLVEAFEKNYYTKEQFAERYNSELVNLTPFTSDEFTKMIYSGRYQKSDKEWLKAYRKSILHSKVKWAQKKRVSVEPKQTKHLALKKLDEFRFPNEWKMFTYTFGNGDFVSDSSIVTLKLDYTEEYRTGFPAFRNKNVNVTKPIYEFGSMFQFFIYQMRVGDEFIIIVPDTYKEDTQLIEKFQKTGPFGYRKQIQISLLNIEN